jgi:hypothetical protein
MVVDIALGIILAIVLIIVGLVVLSWLCQGVETWQNRPRREPPRTHQTLAEWQRLNSR